jgi:DNA-binding response OmpR family regulator
LLDVNMPDMDGFETASMLRSYRRTASTPIIFVTAYVDDAEMARGYSLGAVDYISSPVVPEILSAKVRVFVQMYRMNRELRARAAQREELARAEAQRASPASSILRCRHWLTSPASISNWTANSSRGRRCAGGRLSAR